MTVSSLSSTELLRYAMLAVCAQFRLRKNAKTQERKNRIDNYILINDKKATTAGNLAVNAKLKQQRGDAIAEAPLWCNRMGDVSATQQELT